MPLKLKRSFLKLRNTLLENDDPESLVRKTLLDFSENTFWQANEPFFFVRFPNVILAVTIFGGDIFLGSFRNLPFDESFSFYQGALSLCGNKLGCSSTGGAAAALVVGWTNPMA